MASNYDLYTAAKRQVIVELQSVVDDIADRHIKLGMKASGDFIRSLEIRETELGAQIWGAGYTQYLVNGRGPGKMPPKNNIVKWLQDKFGYDQKTAEKIAFPVRKKIAEKGTKWYSEESKLIDAVLNDERIQTILDRLKIIYTDFVKAEINQMLTAV